MSELNIHQVTDVKVTKNQHKSFMCVTVVTTSIDHRGITNIDKQTFFSKDKKLKFKVDKIRTVE
mgnify:FL=1|jgi:hypothetical protein|tara:strand:+ start:1396 stop:1587 length:192 start_codon:yes stop_codon:yes gene_type:complete